MRRDKALLLLRGRPLVLHVAAAAAAAAGTVALVGDPARYVTLGLPVIPDDFPGEGPLGGICTALRHTSAEWNLVLACDMPAITVEFLRELFELANRVGAAALLPAGPSGVPEPLCAVYHARCLPFAEAALERGVRKVAEGLAGAGLQIRHFASDAVFRNCNTPEEWSDYIENDAPEAGLDEG